MARKRMIDPNIWQSEDFSRLSVLAKVVFIGLFSNADDKGRGRAKAAYIKSLLFPYDEGIRVIDVDKTLSEIASNMSVTFYLHDENEYYSLDKWEKWQTINRPSPSVIPEFDDSSSIIRRTFTESSLNAHGGLKPKRKEEKGSEEEGKRKEDNNAQIPDLPLDFAAFWAAYPKKRNKGDAQKAWDTLNPDKHLVDDIMYAITVARESNDWRKEGGKYIPYPATWLRASGWLDDFDVQVKKKSSNPFMDFLQEEYDYEPGGNGQNTDGFT